MIRRFVAQPISPVIDPWMFARDGRLVQGFICLDDVPRSFALQGESPSIQVELEGYLDNDAKAHLKGQIRAVLLLECQRCLAQMTWPINQHFDYVLVRDDKQEGCMQGEYEALGCPGDTFDIAWFVEEEILLAMPMIAKHENCCLATGKGEAMPCVEEKKNHPFAMLKDMIGKEKA